MYKKFLIELNNASARKMKTIIILLAALVVIAAANPEQADRTSEFSQLTQGLLLISIL
jgi:hypothetical protein